VGAAQLAKQHGDELAPAREAACLTLGARRHNGLLKLGARKKLEQLTEDAAKSRHSGWSSGDRVGLELSRASYRFDQPLSFVIVKR
jgi:hypothetical protein